MGKTGKEEKNGGNEEEGGSPKPNLSKGPKYHVIPPISS